MKYTFAALLQRLRPRRRRRAAINQFLEDYPLFLAIDTLAGNGLTGDYYEFGVFRGRSFTLCHEYLRERLDAAQFSAMRFAAFDSFEGLPATNDPTAPPQYHKGAYAAPRDVFEAACQRAHISSAQLVIIPGFYEESLARRDTQTRLINSRVALCYIDCDIYESAVPVLRFIKPRLQTGSLIVFDDWHRHHATERYGLRRAVKEWQEEYRDIRLNQLFVSKRALFAVDLIGESNGKAGAHVATSI